MIQANLDCLYSEEKAKLKYSHFLHSYKAVIQYEDKKDSKQPPGIRTSVKEQNTKPAEVIEDGESS